MHAAAAAAAAASCMRACVAICVIDTVYQLIYTSAQTEAWNIKFSYRNIDAFWKFSSDELETLPLEPVADAKGSAAVCL
jgi:hypothetical protein